MRRAIMNCFSRLFACLPSPRYICAALIVVFVVSFTSPTFPGPGKAYLLQVGAFVSEVKAAQEVQRLKKYGAFTEPAEINATTWHRVYIGPYRDKATAQKTGATMKKNGIISDYLARSQFAGPGVGSIPPTTKAALNKQTFSPPQREETVSRPPAVPETKERTTTVAPDTAMSFPTGTAAASATSGPSSAAVRTAPLPAPAAPAVPALTGRPAASSGSGQSGGDVKLAQASGPATAPGFRTEKDYTGETKASSPGELHPSLAYNLWYMDMSRQYVNTDYLGKGFVHGPTIGLDYHDFSGSFTFLTSAGAFRGDARQYFSNGQGYLVGEKFDRSDFDLTLKYKLMKLSSFTVSALLGMQWTRLSNMSADYSLDSGQAYTITGNMDIWGPAAGMEIKMPLGDPSTTPLFLSLSGKVMYLRATGKSIHDVPPSGGQYGTSFDGADFASCGWGGNVDAHLTWNIFSGLAMTLGAGIQSAGITDTSPAGNTMRTTNGYYGGYGNLSYTW